MNCLSIITDYKPVLGSQTTNQMSCQIRELFQYNSEYMNVFIVSTNGYLYY
jgi:hypothetical protein